MPPRPDLGPKPRLGYTQSPLERVAERRNDKAWLAQAETDKRALAYVIGPKWKRPEMYDLISPRPRREAAE